LKTIENKTERDDKIFLTQDDRIFVVVIKSYWIDGIVGKKRKKSKNNSGNG
jgi:hypothetical protein